MYVCERGFWEVLWVLEKIVFGGLCLEDKLGGGMWHFVVKGDTSGASWNFPGCAYSTSF